MTDDGRPPGRRGLLRLGATALASGFLLALVVVAALVLLSDDGALGTSGGSGNSNSAAAEPVAVDPEPAPGLLGDDPITGEEVELAAFAGTPVVVNIWASWCPGCNDEAVDLREFAAAHPEIVVLGLDFQDTVSGARAFYERWGWTHPSIFDPSGAQTAGLGLFGLPTTVFLDAQHRVAARVVGATDRAGFERGLELATGA